MKLRKRERQQARDLKLDPAVLAAGTATAWTEELPETNVLEFPVTDVEPPSDTEWPE